MRFTLSYFLKFLSGCQVSPAAWVERFSKESASIWPRSEADPAFARVNTTMSRQTGLSVNVFLKDSRICLFIRFLWTASGTLFLLTTMPRRLKPWWLGFARNRSAEFPIRNSHSLNTLLNSWEWTSRWLTGNFRLDKLGVDYAVSSLRPLARRRFNTSRPALVAILARKPWVLFRLRTLGWKVLFMS